MFREGRVKREDLDGSCEGASGCLCYRLLHFDISFAVGLHEGLKVVIQDAEDVCDANPFVLKGRGLVITVWEWLLKTGEGLLHFFSFFTGTLFARVVFLRRLNKARQWSVLLTHWLNVFVRIKKSGITRKYFIRHKIQSVVVGMFSGELERHTCI